MYVHNGATLIEIVVMDFPVYAKRLFPIDHIKAVPDKLIRYLIWW